MKKFTMTMFALLLCCMVALPAMAAGNNQQGPGGQAQAAGEGRNGQDRPKVESEGRRLHKAHFSKIQAQQQKRAQGMEMRKQMMQSDDPGNTGL